MRLFVKYRFWIVTTLLVLLFIGGMKWLSLSKKPNNNIKPLLSVTVIDPQIQTVGAHLHLSGLTVAREEVLVVSELSGVRVQDVLAEPGQVVKKGQILAVLNRESLTNQVNQLSHEYARVLDEYERAEKLKESGTISQQALIQKRADSQAVKARLDDAKLSLSRTNVVAPKEGIIFARKAAIGDVVNVNQPLYRIAHGDIEFEADVPEANLVNIHAGQKVKLAFSGHPELLDGTVRLIAPSIDYASRTAPIRIALDQKKLNFPVGLFGQAEIIVNQVKGLDLPETALQQDSAGSYVWGLDKENKAIRIPVNVQLRSQGRIIVAPFEPHARIVAKAGAFVKKGEQLKVVEEP